MTKLRANLTIDLDDFYDVDPSQIIKSEIESVLREWVRKEMDVLAPLRAQIRKVLLEKARAQAESQVRVILAAEDEPPCDPSMRIV